jgi:hypothetical protein
MGYSPAILGVGAFRSEIAPHLEYAVHCYASVPTGTPVIVKLFDRDPGSSGFARELAKWCAVPDYIHQQKLQVDAVNLRKLQELAWGCASDASDRDHFAGFVALANSGFEFYYLPDQLCSTNKKCKPGSLSFSSACGFVAVGAASEEAPGEGHVYWNRQAVEASMVTWLRTYFYDLSELNEFCKCFAIESTNVATHVVDVTKFDIARFEALVRDPAAKDKWSNRDTWPYRLADLRKLSELGFVTWLVVDILDMYRPEGIAPRWPESDDGPC